jgi:hypothetical protein
MATPSADATPTSGIARAHRGLALLFVAVAALVQFFLAGLAAFGHSSWDAHAAIGTLLTIVALVILVLAFIGRREALEASAVLFGLMILQNLLGAFGNDVSVLGALHPINGLLILGAAMFAAGGRSVRAGHTRSARA